MSNIGEKVKKVFSSSSGEHSSSSPTSTTSNTAGTTGTGHRSSLTSSGAAGPNTGTGSVPGAVPGIGTRGAHDGTTGTTGTSGLTGAAGTTGTSSTTSPTIGSGTATGTTDGKRESIGSKVFGNHSHGHGLSHANDIDSNNASHEHQHLAHVTHNDVRHIETEEVLRQREHDRHIHHVQHHVQPVKDQHIKDEVHHEKAHPVTNVYEKHSSTEHDQQKYAALGANFKDQETHRAKERTVVDLGEKVTENVHHHVHHVIQPVVEREVHDRHRIHTVIPTKHTTHESPIIHQSTTHEPMHLKDFLSKGGKLDSTTSHGAAGVLHDGDCSRTVEGTGEELARKLHLGGTDEYSHSSSTGNTGLTGSHSLAGNTSTAGRGTTDHIA